MAVSYGMRVLDRIKGEWVPFGGLYPSKKDAKAALRSHSTGSIGTKYYMVDRWTGRTLTESECYRGEGRYLYPSTLPEIDEITKRVMPGSILARIRRADARDIYSTTLDCMSLDCVACPKVKRYDITVDGRPRVLAVDYRWGAKKVVMSVSGIGCLGYVSDLDSMTDAMRVTFEEDVAGIRPSPLLLEVC